jgi:hypothetical protein
MARLSYWMVLLLISALLLGCSSKREIVIQEAKPLPDWYMNPPSNTYTHLVGVGSGTTLEEATQSALVNLLAKLSISIESSMVSQIRTNNYGYEEKTTSNVRSDVAKIRVSNYEVVASEQVRFDQFVVQVESDRQKFIESLSSEIKTGFDDIEHRISESHSDNALVRYRVVEESLAEAKDLIPVLLVLGSMDPAFESSPYHESIQELHSGVEQARRHLVFRVSGNSLSKGMLEPLKNALTAKGFIVADAKNRDGLISIRVVTDSSHSVTAGIQIADLDIKIYTLDHRGNLIGSNNLFLKGHATRGFSLAETNAVEKMSSLIDEKGIETVLGIAP